MNQDDTLIEGLTRPEAYLHPVDSVTLVETHISWVLLAGEFAYKVKKPVDFGFLDFSTLDKRQWFCREELRLNRRFAPQLYLDVVAITGTRESPQMGGEGEALEFAVQMRRFEDDCLLDRLALQGNLRGSDIDDAAGVIAAVHGQAAACDDNSAFGAPGEIRRWFEENVEHIRPLLKQAGPLRQLQRLEHWGQERWQSLAATMSGRKREGFVRECHGDLHLGNMVRVDGRVTLFDCIEFNAQLRWIDVISEIAFLYMDLQHRGLRSSANRFLNLYLQHTGDYRGLAMMSYYLVYRAMVRAKVAVLRAQQEDDSRERAQVMQEYSAYMRLASQYTAVHRPTITLLHGFSGCGKSTFAAQLAERGGGVQVRSDIERKRLFGLSAQQDSGSAIDSGIYSREAGQRVYRQLLELATAVVDAGFDVILDATFLKRGQRKPFQALASQRRMDFRIIDLQLDRDSLRRRVQRRQQQGGDASEATLDVLERQFASAEALDPDEIPHVTCLSSGDNTDWPAVIESLL